MDIATMAGLLRQRARLRTHDRWSRDEVLAYRSRRLALLAGADSVDVGATADSVRLALKRVGAVDVPVTVDLVESIPRTAMGKAPLVRRAAVTGLAP